MINRPGSVITDVIPLKLTDNIFDANHTDNTEQIMNHQNPFGSTIWSSPKILLVPIWFFGTFWMPICFFFSSEIFRGLYNTGLLSTVQAVNRSYVGFALGFIIPPAIAIAAAWFLTENRSVANRLISTPIAISLLFWIFHGLAFLVFSGWDR